MVYHDQSLWYSCCFAVTSAPGCAQSCFSIRAETATQVNVSSIAVVWTHPWNPNVHYFVQFLASIGFPGVGSGTV